MIVAFICLQVDGDILAVYFTRGGKDEPTDLSSCRLLHKNDVILVKSNSPKSLDCLQKTPKRIAVSRTPSLQCDVAGIMEL